MPQQKTLLAIREILQREVADNIGYVNTLHEKQLLKSLESAEVQLNILLSQAVHKAKEEQKSEIVNEVRKVLAFEGALSHSVEKALEELLTQPKE